MGDAGRNQGNRKAGVRELFYFGWEIRYQERQHAERLGDGKFDLEVIGKPQMGESALHRADRVGQIEVHGTEEHDRTDDPRSRPIDDRGSFPFADPRSGVRGLARVRDGALKEVHTRKTAEALAL